MILDNKLYDILKQFANIWLPISITIVTALGQIYYFDYSVAVIILTAIETCLGIFISNSSKKYAKMNKLSSVPMSASNHKVVMTAKEFVEKLYHIAGRKNAYNNHYPYNLCYYDGDKITADCWNLVKSLIWDPTIDSNTTTGRFARPDFSTGLGDWTVGQMIDACYVADPSSVSSDFSDLSKIPAGTLLYYYNGSHAGVYVGDGKVIESTTAWESGIQISEISTDGTRSKDGRNSGRWSKWAKMPWIDYSQEPEPEPPQPTVEWKKGAQVKLKKGSKVYGKAYGYQSWVYDTVLTVIQDSIGDRAVIGTATNPCIGPVYTYDLTAYKAKKDKELQDSDVFIDSEGEIEPNEPITPVDSEGKEENSIIKKIILILIDLINKMFTNKK